MKFLLQNEIFEMSMFQMQNVQGVVFGRMLGLSIFSTFLDNLL